MKVKTVGQLVAELSKYDADAPVHVRDQDTGWVLPLYVKFNDKHRDVEMTCSYDDAEEAMVRRGYE